jgi:hypothetical protein
MAQDSRGSGNVLQSKVSVIDRRVIASNIGFRFQSPSVSGTSLSNAPATGQSFTTLFGRNWGDYETSVSVTFGEIPSLTTKWISNSAVRSLVPRGLSSPATIVVSVHRLRETFQCLFSYDFFIFSDIRVDTKTKRALEPTLLTSSKFYARRDPGFRSTRSPFPPSAKFGIALAGGGTKRANGDSFTKIRFAL